MRTYSFFPGIRHQDSRGRLISFNNLDINQTKRFYLIESDNPGSIRAWQGHVNEQKWFFVTSGIYRFVIIRPDSWENPSTTQEYDEIVISATDNVVLHLPGGYISGFDSLVAQSRVLVFSDFTLDESLADDFRYDKTLWYNWNQNI